jgi:formylglycine-generating enzyme required for sulfatase activity/serine/threonine protein kinase
MTVDAQPSGNTPHPGAAGLETVVRGYEAAWLRGERPDIDSALAGLAGAARAAALVELAHTELELRLKAGEPACAADYLRRYPELGGQRSVVRDLIETEHRHRGHAAPGPGAAPDLPGYELPVRVGRGGMGEVYKAFDPRLKRWVALKWVRVDRARAEHLARFRREAEALARLAHPHIVKVHGLTQRDGEPILEMEYVTGGTLEDRLGDARVAPTEAARLVSILAWAVHASHEAGVVHRDLKPANVLMDGPVAGNPGNVLGGFPKISDFGLAALTDAGSGQTLSGSLVGTPAYMSPEQAAGKTKEVGPPADVWALGVILYRCLSGELPFCGDSVLDTLERIKTMRLRPLREPCPDVSAELEEVCLACLRKDLRGRPTAAELAGRLDSLAGTLTGSSSESIGPRWDETVCERRPPVRKPSSKRKWLIGGGIAGGTLLIGLLGLWAGGVVGVKTPEGTPVAEVNVPNPDVYVDGTPADEASRAGEERDDNDLKLKLCWCPAGTFRMGSPAGEVGHAHNEGPVDVTLSRGFWMGKTEVTQSQWQKVMGTGLGDQQRKGGIGVIRGEGPDHPMYFVTYTEATEFCTKLTASERAAGRLPAGWDYRLPTEAQWEYACRAETTTATAFGDRLGSDQANFAGDFPYNGASPGPSPGVTVPVGSYRPNAWGVLDMHGNVWEWCRDWYADSLAGGLDPEGPPSGAVRLNRGGAFGNLGAACRSATRAGLRPESRYDFLGFRVALMQVRW